MKWINISEGKVGTEDGRRINNYLSNTFDKDFTHTRELYKESVGYKDLEEYKTDSDLKTLMDDSARTSYKNIAYDSYISMVLGVGEAAYLLSECFTHDRGIVKYDEFLHKLTIAIGAELGDKNCKKLRSEIYLTKDLESVVELGIQGIKINARYMEDKDSISWGEAIAFGKDFDMMIFSVTVPKKSFFTVLPLDPECVMGSYSRFVEPVLSAEEMQILYGDDEQPHKGHEPALEHLGDNHDHDACCVIL